MGNNVSAWIAAGLLALSLAAAVGCGTGERGKVPEDTAESLEVLAEDPRRDEAAEAEDGEAKDETEAEEEEITGLPPATKPSRYDPCGIPIAVSIEAMISPKAIVRIQEQLVEKGHLAQDAYNEGQLESATIEAIMAAQEQADLPPVGLPTYSTVEALGLDPESIFTTGDPTCEAGA